MRYFGLQHNNFYFLSSLSIVVMFWWSFSIWNDKATLSIITADNVGLVMVVWHYILSVASLGWVSPGAATEGVTPIFLEKPTTFFAHRCHFYWFHSGVTPLEGVIPPTPFYMSDLVCPLFFVHLSTISFVRMSLPWRVSPGAVPTSLP